MVIAFLLVTGIAVPLLAWQTHRAMEAGASSPPLRLLVPQTLVLQGLLLVLALFAGRSAGLEVPLALRVTLPAVGAGLAWLGLAAITVPLRDRWRPEWEQARTEAMTPRRPGDWGWYILLALVASVAEEIVYRGVAFGLLQQIVGGWWLPALGSALIFGLGHLAQGWRAAVLVVGFGLGFQSIVLASGSLLPAMVVHVVWDLGLAAWIAWRSAPTAAILVSLPSHSRGGTT